jgi:hypothetical protein
VQHRHDQVTKFVEKREMQLGNIAEVKWGMKWENSLAD